jgi:microcystin-dependent protein
VGLSSIAWQIPIGAMIDYSGSTAPTSSFVIPRGQAISRTTYANYFALVSTTYGVGDGSTTFNVPDLGGRVIAGSEASESRLTSAVSGCNGSTLGATCGAQSTTLTTTELPAHTHAVSGTTAAGSAHLHEITAYTTHTGGATTGLMADTDLQNSTAINSGSENSHTHTFSVTSGSAGTGSAFSKTQPTIVLTKLLRVL